jgi:hypothetical protein
LSSISCAFSSSSVDAGVLTLSSNKFDCIVVIALIDKRY